jgi:hypothetical protein
MRTDDELITLLRHSSTWSPRATYQHVVGPQPADRRDRADSRPEQVIAEPFSRRNAPIC